MAEKKLSHPEMILTKNTGWFVCTFNDPKKALWVPAELLKLYLILQVLETEGQSYSIEDIIKLSKDKTVKYKEFIIENIKDFELKYLQGAETLVVEKTTVLVPVNTWEKPRNIWYDCINAIWKIAHFDISKNTMINMKTFNMFLKKFEFPSELSEFIDNMPIYKNFLIKNDFTITDETRKIYTIQFLWTEIYKFFYNGDVHKNISTYLGWLKDFVINYEIMLLSIKVADFYVKNIEWTKEVKSGQIWLFYYSNRHDIERLLNYTNLNFETVKDLIIKLSTEYKKENLSFSIKTIVKNMYKYEVAWINDTTEIDMTYPKEFIDKMNILWVNKENYGKHYNEYLLLQNK